jgi:hypothetical protein
VRWSLALLAVVLAGSLWFFLTRQERPDVPRTRDPSEVEREENPTLTRGHEVLTLWAHTPDKIVPPGTEVGYRTKEGVRWRFVDPNGRQMYTDAPLGRLEVLAKAPGYPEVKSVVILEPGVPAETVLLLRAAK